MKRYNPREILISVHVYKAGGSSMMEVLRQWFKEGFHHHVHNHFTDERPVRVNPSRLPASGLLVKRPIPICVHGHFDGGRGYGVQHYYPEATQFITFLREPLDCQLSHYFFHKRLLKEGALYIDGVMQHELPHAPDVDAFLRNYPSTLLHFFPWKFTLDNYPNIIEENFVHIGCTETMQLSLDILSRLLKKDPVKATVENASPRDEMPSPEAVHCFKERHAVEYAVYSYACQLNQIP